MLISKKKKKWYFIVNFLQWNPLTRPESWRPFLAKVCLTWRRMKKQKLRKQKFWNLKHWLSLCCRVTWNSDLLDLCAKRGSVFKILCKMFLENIHFLWGYEIVLWIPTDLETWHVTSSIVLCFYDVIRSRDRNARGYQKKKNPDVTHDVIRWRHVISSVIGFISVSRAIRVYVVCYIYSYRVETLPSTTVSHAVG